MGQSHGATTDGSSSYGRRDQGPDDHEPEQRAVESALQDFEEQREQQADQAEPQEEQRPAAEIETPGEDEPQPWHQSFTSRDGIGGILDSLPESEADGSGDSQQALSDSYDQFFDRMDEMSTAADEAASAQRNALGRSQEEREAARTYENGDIRRDKTGVPGRDRGRRNAEENRIKRGTDVAGPHSVPWEESDSSPQDRTLWQQESIEADAAELNTISEEAHQGIDHSERAAAVRTAASDRTNSADAVLDLVTIGSARDEPGYEVDFSGEEGPTVGEESDSWAQSLADSHGSDTVEEIGTLSREITDGFVENAAEAGVEPHQFTEAPSRATVSDRIATLVDEHDQSPRDAAYNVADEFRYDEQTRHVFDGDALDPRDALDETQLQRVESATQDLQETPSDITESNSDSVERKIAHEMLTGADVFSAQSSALQNAAQDDTFNWPIEELDVYQQHRASVEGYVEELYDPNDDSQHQVGILKDTDDPRTPENHLKFTWFKSSGTDGKITNLDGEESMDGPTDDVEISGSRDYLREGDRVRFVRGTVDEYKDQKQLAVRGITDIKILEEGDGPIIYEGMGRPNDTTFSEQDLDVLSDDREEVDPDDFNSIDGYLEAVDPSPEERHPGAGSETGTAREIIPTSDAPADLDSHSNVERIEDEDGSRFEVAHNSQNSPSSNPWKAKQQHDREKEARRQRRYSKYGEENQRRNLQRWDVPDNVVDDIIQEEREEQVEQETEQSMSYHRSQSETEFGYDTDLVHLDLPTDSERPR